MSRVGRSTLAIAVFLWCPNLATAQQSPYVEMRQHVIAANAEFSACAIFDVNRDGQLDVYSGGAWYELPSWKAHPTRIIPRIRGRYDDYSNLPLDVDHDGWLDVISVNYRSNSIFWSRNPGTSDATWETHLIDSPGPSETGRLVDINGDGRLDLLPNSVSQALWYEAQPLNERNQQTTWAVEWRPQRLPSELAAHGIGWGDINRDGLLDLVTANGWCEQRRDGDELSWRFHRDFQLHRDASIPILVVDVDQDGDSDLVWGRGHDHGLYWLEHSTSTKSPDRDEWTWHVIDTSWSGAHALLWADLDGDGRGELIAGKRYLPHEGRDPGEWDVGGIFRYVFDGTRRTWWRHPLVVGERAGFDLDVGCADLDGDGDLDLVAPTRGGLSWFENVARSHDWPTEERTAYQQQLAAAHYRDAESLLELRVDQQRSRPLADRWDWGVRRDQILLHLQQVMGDLPRSHYLVPLEPQIESEEEGSGYRRLRLSYASDGRTRVPAILLIPHGLTRPAPAMLCLHQTQDFGKREVCGLSGRPSMHYAHELAQRGYICLAPDYPSFGDYHFDFAANRDLYPSGSLKAIWDNLRGVDLLESWPMVDRDRIGCIGHSLGGHNGLFTAAFDQRLRAVITSCGFCGFPEYFGGQLQGWTSDRYMPRIRDLYGNDARRLPFDFDEILAAQFPRPVFINAPEHDDNFARPGVERVVARARVVYGKYGTTDRLRVVYPDSAHDFPDAIRAEAYEWLKTALEAR